ncbi:MAG: hypothetical protein CI953_828 [Methanohalophilus sp.]|nr:MAG: hypothetical protein CI953_828 [Methanohalophilus sp.]
MTFTNSFYPVTAGHGKETTTRQKVHTCGNATYPECRPSSGHNFIFSRGGIE